MNDRFLKACRGEPVDATPVWYMRQAGRYQPEYRALRERFTLLEIAKNPDLCAEVTCRPVEQLGVDAAILFSDIMIPLEPFGVAFEIRENVGPVVERPIRQRSDLRQLRSIDPERDLPFVRPAIERIVRRLSVPLIGFSGAPFTLASYLVEGGPSRLYLETKRMMWNDPDTWHELLERLGEVVVAYLAHQVRSGAGALQIFDSWIGALSPADYERYVLGHMQTIFAALKPLGVPIIYFGVGTSALLERMERAGADVIGLDWRIALDEGRRRLGSRPVQGNLDPCLLAAPWTVTARRAKEILEQNAGRPGHIFNLGHGVLPFTEGARLKKLTEWVHTASDRAAVR